MWFKNKSPPLKLPISNFAVSGIVISCENSKASLLVFQRIVASVELSTASWIVIPAPFAEADVSPEP